MAAGAFRHARQAARPDERRLAGRQATPRATGPQSRLDSRARRGGIPRHLADQPRVRSVYPSRIMDAYHAMWTSRERWFAALDQLPQTFCHMDASRKNTFTRIGPDNRTQTVLIDWAFAGIAALAEELTSPIVASVMFRDAAVDDARQIE